MWDDVEMMPPEDLEPHPRNAEVYGDGPDDALTESVRAHGVLTPILATMGRRVISGHRRLLAAADAGLAEVPVIRRDFGGEAAELEAIIEANQSRIKSNEQIAREGRILLEIETARAAARMKVGRPRPSGNVSGGSGEARDVAAARIGRSGRWLADAVEVVVEIDARAAAGNAAGAASLIEVLNESVSRAHEMLPKAKPPRKAPPPPDDAPGDQAEAVLAAHAGVPTHPPATEADNEAFKAARDVVALRCGLGQTVPAVFVPAIQARDRVGKLLNALRACEREITALTSDGPSGGPCLAAALRRACRKTGDGSTHRLEPLRSAVQAVKMAIPYTLCPDCWDAHPGRANTDCQRCDGSGVVTEEAFAKLPAATRHPVENRDRIAECDK